MTAMAAAAADQVWFEDLSLWILCEVADKPVYEMLEEIRGLHHPDTLQARIKLALKTYSQDLDGKITYGECIKAPELWQRVADIDVVIALNKKLWPYLKPTAQRALIDGQLCRLQPKIDSKTFEHAETADGIKLWRIRKPEVAAFHAEIQRHGFWTGDLARLAATVSEARRKPLFRDQLIEAAEQMQSADVVRLDDRRGKS